MDDIQWSVVSQIFDADNKNMNAEQTALSASCISSLPDGIARLSTLPNHGAQLNGAGMVKAPAPLTALEYAMSAGNAAQTQRRATSRGRNPITRTSKPLMTSLPTIVSAALPEGTSQVISSDSIPESLAPGETLYAVVDGVAYEIVGGSTTTSQLSMPVTDGAGLSLVDFATIGAACTETLSLGSSNVVNSAPVCDNTLAIDPSSLVCSDYSQLPSGSTVTTCNTPDGLQIVILPPGNPFNMASLTNGVGGVAGVQQLVLQPGQSLPAEFQELMGNDLPGDLQGYQFVVGDNSTSSGNAAAQASDFTGLGGQASDADILAMLADASGGIVVPEEVSFSRTVLAEECADDDEFEHLVSEENTASAVSGSQETAPQPASLTGYLNSYLGFVRGEKVETLSGVANSAIIRRPPLPRYIPEPNSKTSCTSVSHASNISPVTVSLVYPDDPNASGSARLVVVPAAGSSSHVANTPTAVVSVEKVDGQSILRQSKSKSRSSSDTDISAFATGETSKSSRVVKRRRRSEDDSDEETLSNSEFSENGFDSDSEDPMWKPSLYEADKQHGEGSESRPTRGRPRGKGRPPKALAGRGRGGNNASVSIASTSTGYVLQVGSDSTGMTHFQDVIPFNPTDPHQYQKGKFVVERKDLYKCDGFPIWKIEVGRLLQKYDPEVQSDGSLVHKSASIYSSWSGNIRTTFKAIDTEIISASNSRRPDMVRVLPAYLPHPIDNSVELDPLMNLFNIYVQCLVSQAIDPSFLMLLRQQKEEYYDTPISQIDGLLETSKMTILSQIQWKDTFQSLLEDLPYYELTDACLPDTQHCQATASSEQYAAKIVHLFGPVYSREDLTTSTRQVHRAEAKGIPIALSALEHFVTYHALHHYKYLLYRKCLEEVVYIRQSRDKSDPDILASCLQNRSWIQQLFHELKDLVQKCIIISIVDASDMPDEGSQETDLTASLQPTGDEQCRVDSDVADAVPTANDLLTEQAENLVPFSDSAFSSMSADQSSLEPLLQTLDDPVVVSQTGVPFE